MCGVENERISKQFLKHIGEMIYNYDQRFDLEFTNEYAQIAKAIH